MKGMGFYNEDFLKTKEDKELIEENITRLLLTTPYERPFSAFGCKLKEYLFSGEFVLKEDIILEIKKSIYRWEPRVKIKTLNVDLPSRNEIKINLSLIEKSSFVEFDIEKLIRF